VPTQAEQASVADANGTVAQVIGEALMEISLAAAAAVLVCLMAQAAVAAAHVADTV
jgi:hypothetical protein